MNPYRDQELRQNEAIRPNFNRRNLQSVTPESIQNFLLKVPEGTYDTQKLAYKACYDQTTVETTAQIDQQMPPYDNPYDPHSAESMAYDEYYYAAYNAAYQEAFPVNYVNNWPRYDDAFPKGTITITHPTADTTTVVVTDPEGNQVYPITP